MFKHFNLESIFECIGQKLKKHGHFKVSSRDEVFISSRQKHVNSKRHFTIDMDDFIPVSP